MAEVAGRRSTETTEATAVRSATTAVAATTEAKRRSATILLAMRRVFDF